MENQPNHSIKLAFIPLVCYSSSNVVGIFLCFLSQKEGAKNGAAGCLIWVKTVREKVIFTSDEDIYSYASILFFIITTP